MGVVLFLLRYTLFLLTSLLVVALQICNPLDPVGERFTFCRLLYKTRVSTLDHITHYQPVSLLRAWHINGSEAYLDDVPQLLASPLLAAVPPVFNERPASALRDRIAANTARLSVYQTFRTNVQGAGRMLHTPVSWGELCGDAESRGNRANTDSGPDRRPEMRVYRNQ